MRRNLSHIAAMAFNEPLLLEPAYARVFFCALGKEMGAGSLAVPQQAVQLDADGMQLAVTDYMAGGQRPAKSYQVKNGIAILPVSGTLVHKLGTLRPYSGMTGYDGLTARLQMAVNDPDVRGILLDIDSPGGQAAGAFDCADMIYRLREQKPVWALCNDMACSAAMLLAAACTRRLVTQTAKIGSIGVMMAHTSYEKQLAQEGVDITLIYSGQHKVDGNSIQALPAGVRADFQRRIDQTSLYTAGTRKQPFYTAKVRKCLCRRFSRNIFIKRRNGLRGPAILRNQISHRKSHRVLPVHSKKHFLKFLFYLQMLHSCFFNHLSHITVTFAVENIMADETQKIGIFPAVSSGSLYDPYSVFEEFPGRDLMEMIPVSCDPVLPVRPVEKENIRPLKTDGKLWMIGCGDLSQILRKLPGHLRPESVMCIYCRHGIPPFSCACSLLSVYVPNVRFLSFPC